MISHKLLSGIAALAMIGATTGNVRAKSICYESNEQGVAMRLEVKHLGKLTGNQERRKFDHPIVKAYSVHGNRVDKDNTEFTYTVTGTVTVARGVGARMGLTVPQVIVLGGYGASLDVYDCNSDEPSATPDTWDCLAFDVGINVPGRVFSWTFNRVNPPRENEFCSAFVLPNTGNDPPE